MPKLVPVNTENTSTEIISKSAWTPRKVDIPLRLGGSKVVGCVCLGALAVHRSLDTEEPLKSLWGLSHRPTGVSIVLVRSEQDAKQIGEVLWNRCRLALQEPTKGKVRMKLPLWVHPWLKKCQLERRFVEPPSG